LNQIVTIKENRPFVKNGTPISEIFENMPGATRGEIADCLADLFAGLLSTDRNMTIDEKSRRAALYANRVSSYPGYALRAAVDKLIDNEKYVPAIVDLVKEIRNQTCINIKWVD
jgi:DNA-directed RNA polymerase subunit F